jgi:hypothetical protein
MAEIEFLLPTVQYGNVKVRATPEELGVEGVQDAGALGVAAAVYLNLFTQGFKLGTQIDVDYTGPESASEEAPPGDPHAAAERLADGRSPRTVDEANEMAKQVIENELGSTTELPHDVQSDAPWTQDSPAVDVKPKPWETGKAAPTNAVKVAEIDW